jgi:hypothetical protein
MASPENHQAALPVLDHEVELGCVFYAKELNTQIERRSVLKLVVHWAAS